MDFLVIVGLLYLLGVPVLLLALWSRTARLDTDLRQLRRHLDGLRSDLAKVEPQLSAARAEPARAPAAEAAPAAPMPATDTATQAAPAAPALADPAASRKRRFEERFTSRWLVWLGAVTIALAGTFLVKHAIDNDWITPAMRVALAEVLGFLLVAAGERLRRRPVPAAAGMPRPTYVAAALTASGLFVAFAGLYAAHALYHLIHPLLAFAALSAVALAGLALALLHGPLVALLGLLGGYLTPLLVHTEQPSAAALFLYLLVITVASLGLIRRRGWWHLGFAALAGAALWPFAWMWQFWSPGDALAVAAYLLAAFIAFLALVPPFQDLLQTTRQPDASPRESLAWIAILVFMLLLFALVRMGAYGGPVLVVLALWVVLSLGFARTGAGREGVAVLAAIVALALFATWHLPEIVSQPQPLATVEGLSYGQVRSPILPPELDQFAVNAVVIGALFGIGGFIALWGAVRPAIWAALSAGVPALLLAIAYWRFVDFALDFRWAPVALILAGANLLAARRLERYRSERGYEAPLAFHAAAVSAFLALGATMILRQAWLTVALAVQLPALAWITARLATPALRLLAAAIAAIVLARLALNYGILDYPLRGGLFNWLLYGYGVPAGMFFWAAYLFGVQGETRLAELLRAGALVFCVLLVSLEIRALVAGRLDAPYSPLREQSLQTLVWLTFAAALTLENKADRLRVWAARVLAALALLQILVLHLWWSNPIWTQEPVGSLPVLNLLFVAYAVPAAFLFRLAAVARTQGPKEATLPLKALGFALILVYLTLEVRRAFQGSVLLDHHSSDAEYYAYSMAWLLFAGVLLAAGIRLASTTLRYASLAVLMLTVLKVFIGDMSDLTGLTRVASFLLLGLSLVGIGWLYQRFVFPLDRSPAPPAAPGHL